MTNQTARAKSLILQWFDESKQPAEMRAKLSSGVDRFFNEIAKRDAWSECRTVLLGDSLSPRFFASGRDWRTTPSENGLAVSTFLPGWGFGWHGVFRDKFVYDQLSWLGHYARQYVHRSHVAKVLMIAWERDGAVLHPFGSQGHSQRYDSGILPKRALSDAFRDNVLYWGRIEAPRIRSRWTHRNTLEPAIHQAVFHFLRGQKLISAGFGMEALVAFDCVIQSLQAMPWSLPVGDPRRTALVSKLGLSRSDGELAEYIYFLRNEFAAHAGGWRWWDSEDYADEAFMQNASNFTLRLLQRAADAEPTVRRIDPAPTSWSHWLVEGFPLLFLAIWFKPNA